MNLAPTAAMVHKLTALAVAVPLAPAFSCVGHVDESDTTGANTPAHATGVAATPRDNPASVAVGEAIFFDDNLSLRRNQACAVCHGREVGWTGPYLLSNLVGGIYEGSVHGRFGNRRAPSSAYGPFAPVLTWERERGFVGGSFWDGRATGWKLGDAAADQAQGPFLNPLEQAMPDGATVVERVCSADYGERFRDVWGQAACDSPDQGFNAVALSIADFERSPRSSSFSSKFDAHLAGDAVLTAQEQLGLELFTGRAQCANCHPVHAEPGVSGPLFTDFSYDNLGVPKNSQNPYYLMDSVTIDGEVINPDGRAWIDLGLGALVALLAEDATWRDQPHATEPLRTLSRPELLALAAASRGKHQVPTLRNVDQRPTASFVKAYTHNGYFKTLSGLVHFYNTRDVLPRCAKLLPEELALANHCWPAPEVSDNLNTDEMGNLGLSAAEEQAIVAFLATLSDGWAARDLSRGSRSLDSEPGR
jgi:cytochrome c peroxidase